MIISSQGEACSPNDDIKALDLNGTKALRDRLRKIKASSSSGEDALLAMAEIELGVEQAEKEQEKLTGSSGKAVSWFSPQLSSVKLAGSTGRVVSWLLPQKSTVKLAGSSGRFLS